LRNPLRRSIDARLQELSVWQALGLTVCVWLVSLPVRAQVTPVHVRMAADGCPSAALLREKLEPLLGEHAGALDISSAPLAAADVAQAEFVDLGARYRIDAAGQRREWDDPARDCVERARVAAVFIALNARATPAEPASRADTVEPVKLGVRIFGQVAYAPHNERGTGGAGLGAWLGYACWHVDVSAALLAPVQVALRSTDAVAASATLTRLPLALTTACMFRAGRFGFGPSLGFGLDILRIRGSGTDRPQTGFRVDPGLLAAAELRWRLATAWSLGLRLGFDAFARAYELEVEPAGSLGTTPRLWLSASLGLEWRFL
jgi:hypothetical protein